RTRGRDHPVLAPRAFAVRHRARPRDAREGREARHRPTPPFRMSAFIANARMYAVAPDAEAAWRTLIERVTADAGVALEYIRYDAPQPLEHLWARPDLGAVQMCG